MTSLTDLADRLSNIHLASTTPSTNPGRHVLSFKFPAADILPDDSLQLYLDAPAEHEQRLFPDEGACHIKTIGTRFFATLQAPQPSAFLGTAHYGETKRLLDAVDQLRTQPGHSWIYMVSWNIGFRTWHRFRLLTTDDIHAESTGQEFDLDDDDWNRLTKGQEGKDWIAILDDLVSRSSDRAFFEVRKTLMGTHGLEAVRAEEARWEDMWNKDHPGNPEELFLERLQPQTDDDFEALRADGDRLLDLILPCTHVVRIRKILVLALKGDACAQQKCPTCGQRILNDQDIAEIEEREEYEAAVAFRKLVRSRQGLDKNTPTSQKQYGFSTHAILQALNKLSVSCSMPIPVCPKQLNPIHYPETRLIMDRFQERLRGDPVTLTLGPLDLLESLYSVAMETQMDGVALSEKLNPPDLSYFLVLWLTRAVNYLTKRMDDEILGLVQEVEGGMEDIAIEENGIDDDGIEETGIE